MQKLHLIKQNSNIHIIVGETNTQPMGCDAQLAFGGKCPGVKCLRGVLRGKCPGMSGYLFWGIFRGGGNFSPGKCPRSCPGGCHVSESRCKIRSLYVQQLWFGPPWLTYRHTDTVTHTQTDRHTYRQLSTTYTNSWASWDRNWNRFSAKSQRRQQQRQ